MKLLYTDIQFDMTEILTKEALNKQKQISEFYIAPNSLSFEKERAVLEFCLSRLLCNYYYAFCSDGALFCLK